MSDSDTVTYHSAIVGVKFYDGAAEAIQKAGPGADVELWREPGNKFDSNAIAVHIGEKKVGHIPRQHAAIIAPLLDQGARVVTSKIRKGTVTGLEIELYQPEHAPDYEQTEEGLAEQAIDRAARDAEANFDDPSPDAA